MNFSFDISAKSRSSDQSFACASAEIAPIKRSPRPNLLPRFDASEIQDSIVIQVSLLGETLGNAESRVPLSQTKENRSIYDDVSHLHGFSSPSDVEDQTKEACIVTSTYGSSGQYKRRGRHEFWLRFGAKDIKGYQFSFGHYQDGAAKTQG